MGHKRTIRPNAKKLSTILAGRHQMDWDTFAKKVKSCQRGFMGEPDEMRPGRGEFHEFPSSCVCKRPYDLHIPIHSNHTIASFKPITNIEFQIRYQTTEYNQCTVQSCFYTSYQTKYNYKLKLKIEIFNLQ